MWTLKYLTDERSFEDWGLGNPVLQRNSQAADLFTATASGREIDLAELFPYGGTVTIYKDRAQSPAGIFSGGSVYFAGRRILNPRAGSGPSEAHEYTFAGPWWYLENLTFQQPWYSEVDPENLELSVIGGYRTHVFLNEGINGTALTTAAQITAVINFAANQCSAPIQVDATLPAINVWVDEQRDITCAEAIIKQLRFIPDAVTWFDYATSPPTLYVKRRADLTAVAFAIGDGDTIESLQITARPDLQRAAIVLKFESAGDVNGVPTLAVTEQKMPVDATGFEVGAFLATVPLQGASMTNLAATIDCATINAGHATEATRLTWWKTKLPWLASSRITSLTIPVDTVTRETDPALPRELVSGQIADWMGFDVEEETITAKASYTVQDGAAADVSQIVEETITVRVHSTNGTSGTYYSSIVNSFAEPIPSGLASALYTATSELQYDGALVFHESELGQLIGMGDVLNLTGGVAGWATMRALVQQVTEDLETGRTTITFGPAKHLGLDDLIELTRINRNRYNPTPADSRATGSYPSGSGTLGQQTSKENSNSGAGAIAKLILKNGTGIISISPGLFSLVMSASGGGLGTITLHLSEAAQSMGSGGKTIALREVEVCVDDGAGGFTTKLMRVLASEVYDP